MKELQASSSLLQKKQSPLSILGACSTIINLLLATGPFTLPYAYKEGGLYLTCLVFWVTVLLAFIAADSTIDFIAQANAITHKDEQTTTIQSHIDDSNIENSKFFIREKLEIGYICRIFLNRWAKRLFYGVLIIYLYASMIIKCVTASLSLSSVFSYMLYSDKEELSELLGFDFYYISIIIFASVVFFFSIGSIETSKYLQIIVFFLRLFSITLMIFGSLYSLIVYGLNETWHLEKLVKWDTTKIHYVFGNTIFINMVHAAIPGIFYPMRPQKAIRPTLFTCFLLGGLLLTFECFLAIIAFGGIDSNYHQYCNKFPCSIQPLFNLNFLAVPFISEIVNFYPMLNVATYPIMAITLRNNLLQMVGGESKKQKPSLKERIVSTMVISFPGFVISGYLKEDAQLLLAYEGGYSGLLLMFVLPGVLLFLANGMKIEERLKQNNIHKSLFWRSSWQYLLWFFALLTFVMVTYGLLEGTTSPH